MKVKMSQVLGLSELYADLSNRAMPVKLAYKLSKLLDSATQESKFYSDELKKLVADYSVKDENGNPKTAENADGIQIQPEHLQDAQNRFDELLGLEVEMPDVTFSIDEFEGLELTMDKIKSLLPWIQE